MHTGHNRDNAYQTRPSRYVSRGSPREDPKRDVERASRSGGCDPHSPTICHRHSKRDGWGTARGRAARLCTPTYIQHTLPLAPGRQSTSLRSGPAAGTQSTVYGLEGDPSLQSTPFGVAQSTVYGLQGTGGPQPIGLVSVKRRVRGAHRSKAYASSRHFHSPLWWRTRIREAMPPTPSRTLTASLLVAMRRASEISAWWAAAAAL